MLEFTATMLDELLDYSRSQSEPELEMIVSEALDSDMWRQRDLCRQHRDWLSLHYLRRYRMSAEQRMLETRS